VGSPYRTNATPTERVRDRDVARFAGEVRAVRARARWVGLGALTVAALVALAPLAPRRAQAGSVDEADEADMGSRPGIAWGAGTGRLPITAQVDWPRRPCPIIAYEACDF
jgi:hypothetical protein